MPFLSSLRLRDFRCFARLSCELADGVTLFIGDNAQGKTSLLEAVCVLLRLQSPRASALSEIARFGQPNFGVSGDFGDHRLQFLFRDGHRALALDGIDPTRPTDYLAASGLIVWMGNDDMQLVRGTSDSRRRYLDFLGTQAFADYRPALLAYDKALRSRNRLLKDERPDQRQIDAYTKSLVPHGEKLTRLRARLVAELSPWAADTHAQVGGTAEVLTLRYEPGAGSDFAAALEESRDEESRRRLTVVGPHRDELLLALNDTPAAKFASEGQQRTIALALKLAQARLLQSLRTTDPLILIDDIFGELDPGRRNSLLSALPIASQKLITTTHLGWLADAPTPARIFHVNNGTLTPN